MAKEPTGYKRSRAAVAAQVGAADRALASRPRQVTSESHPSDGAIVRCASLKSNMGHLEAAAAAAGLAALVTGPLLAAVVAVNAQLRGSANEARCCFRW